MRQVSQEKSSPRKIFILDENPIMREGLASVINGQDDLEVCGMEGNPHVAERKIEEICPDLVIADVTFQSGSGLGLIKKLRGGDVQPLILVLSKENETFYAQRALRAGADGYIMKFKTPEKVLKAVYEVINGQLHLSPELMEVFAQKFVKGDALLDDAVTDKLSTREFEVFSLIGQGYKTPAIAEELRLSLKTVQSYCSRIKEKLELPNARELLHYAIKWHEQSRRVAEREAIKDGVK